MPEEERIDDPIDKPIRIAESEYPQEECSNQGSIEQNEQACNGVEHLLRKLPHRLMPAKKPDKEIGLCSQEQNGKSIAYHALILQH
jgi:hypothetical protein